MWEAIAVTVGKALLPILEKAAVAALPIVWQTLVKAGVITKAQADLVKAGTHIITVMQAPYTGDQKPEITTNLKQSDGTTPVGG